MPASHHHDLIAFRSDPVVFLRSIAKDRGDVASLHLDSRELTLLAHPDAVRDVLVTQASKFVKGPGLLRTRPLLGDGLLTSDGPVHDDDRRSLLPAFSTNAALAEYAPTMVDATRALIAEWRDGDTVDVHRTMTRLALAIASRCLFGVDLSDEADSIRDAVTTSIREGYGAFASADRQWPRPTTAEAATAFDTLRSAADEALHCPMHATPLTERLDEVGFERRREHALTLMLAGHESLSNTMTWAFYLLDRHPDAWATMKAEIDAVAEDAFDQSYELSRSLPFTRAVFAETLRLFPSAWMLSREAREDVAIGDLRLGNGAIVVVAQCVTHVDERWFPRPLDFRPERWLDGWRPRRGSFFPFGSGPRLCVGELFTWVEAVLVLAVIGRQWKMQIPAEFQPEYEALVTLRPKDQMTATLVQH